MTTIDLHFIPSHCGIGRSEDVDELAKQAHEEGADDQVDHLPVLSSYKLHLRKAHRAHLLADLPDMVQPSSNLLNPGRKPFYPRWEESSSSRTWIDAYAEETDTHPLVNRARTGHSLARAHLYNIRMQDEPTCRHCDEDVETIRHQLLPRLPSHVDKPRHHNCSYDVHT